MAIVNVGGCADGPHTSCAFAGKICSGEGEMDLGGAINEV